MKDPQFFMSHDPKALTKEYGSPLFVYNETIFRKRIREILSLVSYPHFGVHMSVKANNNLTLLKIAKEEGVTVDAMSPGEIFVEEKAGFSPEDIFFITNNVSLEEMTYAHHKGILLSVDSLSQLETFGKAFPGSKVAIRINSGVGAGHSDKVVTGGHHTKFAIIPEDLKKAREIAKQYHLTITGINQHIGSFFLEKKPYIDGVKALLPLAMEFPDLTFIDLGGGFGMPYDPLTQSRLDLEDLGKDLSMLMEDFAKAYGRPVTFKVEPGRYLTAECCVLLGTVTALKESYGTRYVGSDIGFNVLIRPMLYEAYHHIETYPKRENMPVLPYTVVGNICESGDILAKDRLLPAMSEGDVIAVHDAGAYGYVMASNYNNRLRPAEVLIREDGSLKLIRRRDTLEDLVRNFDL